MIVTSLYDVPMQHPLGLSQIWKHLQYTMLTVTLIRSSFIILDKYPIKNPLASATYTHHWNP